MKKNLLQEMRDNAQPKDLNLIKKAKKVAKEFLKIPKEGGVFSRLSKKSLNKLLKD